MWVRALSSQFKVSYWCGDVVTGTLCGSRCCNKAIVHNYNRWLKSFTLLKNHWGLGSTATRWHWESQHPTFSTQTHTHTHSLFYTVCLPLWLFFSLSLWCLPFHWLCLMQECVFLCLALARGNNTSHWMVVCSGAFSDIQSLLF